MYRTSLKIKVWLTQFSSLDASKRVWLTLLYTYIFFSPSFLRTLQRMLSRFTSFGHFFTHLFLVLGFKSVRPVFSATYTMPMKEAFEECSHLNMTSLTLLEPRGLVTICSKITKTNHVLFKHGCKKE